MKFGFSSIFSFRPHVQQIWYLSLLARQAGHDASFLACDGGLDLCYARAIKGTSALVECPKCMIGGLRGYGASPLTSISRSVGDIDAADMVPFVQSSISTVLRTETVDDLLRPEADELRAALSRGAARAYESTLRWIAKDRLEGVFCFNGRMDITRAVMEACRKAGVPFVSVERTWFGDGLQLIPNGDCLALDDLRRMNAAYDNVPLTEPQALKVASLMASRFLKRNSNEWRVYNIEASRGQWPATATGRRVLLLPSSWNEVQGHADWTIGWREATDGFDWVLRQLNIAPHEVLVRCHPNWAERIGRSTGALSQQHYDNWTRERGIRCIRSDETANTYDLVQEADLVIVNGSTVAFEAGGCGKPVVCVGSGLYAGSSMAILVRGPGDADKLGALDKITAESTIRSALRFGYTITHRFAQFVEHVKSLSSARYAFFEGADGKRLAEMIRTGRLEPDDPEVAPDTSGEDRVVSAVLARRWEDLFVARDDPRLSGRPQIRIARRKGLGWLEEWRERMPTGDR